MKYILLMTLLFSGAVYSAPENPFERQQFTYSLNSMASQVMGWYSCLLNNKNFCSPSLKNNLYKNYHQLYPDNLNQIELTGTDLKSIDSNKKYYRFSVNILLKQKDKPLKTLSKQDQFTFLRDENNEFILEKMTSSKAFPEANKDLSEYSAIYYKHREVAYAWLAYLDKKNVPTSLKNHLDSVQYSVQMGTKNWLDSAKKVLKKRNIELYLGGHLLRKITDISKSATNNIHRIELSIEWKGENKQEQSVLANIQQQIKYKILDNGEWVILSVKEKHLLSNIKPWIGLLC